jgi:hypothetical protein
LLLNGVSALIVLGLIAASVSNYVAVAQAQHMTTLQTTYGVDFVGTDSRGALRDTGLANLTMRLAVSNPSPRLLFFSSVTYKAWIRDFPMEAGLQGLGRTDITVRNATGDQKFFRAFLGSTEVRYVPVPAAGKASLNVTFSLSRASALADFLAVQNITAYAASVRGTAAGIPWLLWIQLVLYITGVPEPVESAPTYQFFISRVILEWGDNLVG